MARARVALFDVEGISAERLVGIYRVLGEVDGPEHYARRLAEVLHTTGHIFSRHGADMDLTIGRLEEALDLCRGLDPVEHRDRDALLTGILTTHEWALYRYGRRPEGLATRRLILDLGRASRGDAWRLADRMLHVAVALVEDGEHDEAASLFAEAVEVTAAGARQSWRLDDDRHRHVTARAAHLAGLGRHAEAAAAYRPLLDESRPHEDRQVPILLYGARLLARADLPDESRAVTARAVRMYEDFAGSDRFARALRPDRVAFHLALDGASDEFPGSAHGTVHEHWSPQHMDRYAAAPATIRAALADPATSDAERVVLKRRLNVRATYAETTREAARRRLLPSYTDVLDLARRVATADPATGVPLLTRALTDRALLLAGVGLHTEGLTDLKEAAALTG
ncbi:hypothetical protein [Streptomyces sp. SID3343]|uniref:hypothetical protein n=1 Tax=Streptomyces sp. SID3343 TaxID=2690260 RepID=UPI00136D6586|nr:hypothetical protein [Streptomyces sp. SID3343]MYV99453.1 hypothetical protein [Streptomyces sp. SID3343]